ncbi:MAG: glycosyltransferase family 39 protein [Cyanobacteria bacterium P01_C01_bin.72]
MGDGGNRDRFFSRESLWLIYLLLAAVVLYTANLGGLPLRDWDEGIVAGVARNIWRAESGSQTWLYPTINYSEPYWNKPPLVHGLIALSYQIFGISEWSTRLAPALLSAASVPLVYLIGREIFPHLSTAILSALVYLNLLPVARHGRVAMLDGAISCWFCFGVWCLLRGRKKHGWLLGTGIALGMICLTKGIMIGVLLGGILLCFIAWDSPKLWQISYLWTGLLLGLIPAISWYTLQYRHYGAAFLGINLGTQTFNRIWSPISTIAAPPWYYLLEIAKYGLPWLIFLPYGLKIALRERHLSWGKLTLTWSVIYLLAISLMKSKLPWYVFPVYPAVSLLVGVGLDRIWRKQQPTRFWQVSLTIIAVVCWLGSGYYGLVAQAPQVEVVIVLLVVAISFSVASVLLWQGNRHFIIVMIAGFYLALLLLFNSSQWLWELNSDFAVKPVASVLREHTPQQKIYTSYPTLRPSLEFYSDRTILPRSKSELEEIWQETAPSYFLVDSQAVAELKLQSPKILGHSGSWQIVTQKSAK